MSIIKYENKLNKKVRKALEVYFKKHGVIEISIKDLTKHINMCSTNTIHYNIMLLEYVCKVKKERGVISNKYTWIEENK